MRLSGPGQADSKDPATWRTTYRCGVNALYVYLALLDRHVDYGELLDTVPINELGTSLSELQEAAQRYGAKAVLVRATPDSLDRLLPAIVHRDEPANVTGHYDLVLQADSDAVTYLDGSGGGVARMNAVDFYRTWTGYALTEAGGTTRAAAVARGVLFGLAACVFGWLAFRLRRSSVGTTRPASSGGSVEESVARASEAPATSGPPSAQSREDVSK